MHTAPRIALSLLILFFWVPLTWTGEKKTGEKKEEKKETKKEEKKEPKTETNPFAELKYRSIGPAAGGRVSRSRGVPGDPLIYYAASASGGVWKSSDAGTTWKPIFDDQPTSSIGAIAVAPSDPNVIYVGSGEANLRGNVQPGNGIYKSTDAGKTWKHVWKQKGQIGQMIVHPTNPDIAFAAVLGSAFGPNPERGVYRTTDGGKTWKQVLKKDADTGAIDVCMDAGNSRILFACLWQARRSPWSLASGGPGSGIWRSGDGGDTWKQLGPGTQNPKSEARNPKQIQNASFQSSKRDGLSLCHCDFAASDLFRISDFGFRVSAAAEDDDNGLPPGPSGRCGIALAPSDSRRVYAIVEAEKGGLYRSDDGGEKWTCVNPNRYLRIRPFYFTNVVVDPVNADIVYCPSLRLLKSIDGGKSFKQIKGPHHVDHHDLWIDPKNPRRMIDSNDGGVDITVNGGETWHAPALPLCQFYHINVDNRTPYHVSGTIQDIGTVSGPSNSLAGEGISLGHWHTVGGGETGFTMPDPNDPNIVYAGEYGGYLSRYDHRTRQARNIAIYPINGSGQAAESLRYRFQWTAPVLVSPHDSKVVYHGANVLFRTTDAGKTWTKISGDLTRDDKTKQKWSGGPITGDNVGTEVYCTIFALAESPKKAGVLWAGSDDGLVHVSTNAGKTWKKVTPPGLPEWGTVGCIEASPHDPAVAYVAVDVHRLDDNKPYLFKTADYGKTWKSLTAGRPDLSPAHKLPHDDYIRVVREDPKTPGLLFIGTETGVSYSRDDGVTWERLKLNLPTVAVSDLRIKDNDLVVGTNGRAIWILDDITPIREWKPLSPRGGEKGEGTATRLLPVQPAYRYRYHGEVYEDKSPGENPPKGAVIHYVLDQKPKEVVLEILDADGKRVNRYTNKKVEPDVKEDDPDQPWEMFKVPELPTAVGVNRFAWDLTHEGGKVIPNAKNDGGEPRGGPLVNPGTYTLKLTVDGKTFTGQVQVKMDPRVNLPASELDEQLKFALQMRDDFNRLAEAVIQLRQIKDQLVRRNALLKDSKDAAELIKNSKALIEKLDKLEAEWHNPKAEVAYDILAMKGGAKLYSQMGQLYEFVKGGDGGITQGMREVYHDQKTELERLVRRQQTLIAEDLARLNEQARSLKLPHVLTP